MTLAAPLFRLHVVGAAKAEAVQPGRYRHDHSTRRGAPRDCPQRHQQPKGRIHEPPKGEERESHVGGHEQQRPSR